MGLAEKVGTGEVVMLDPAALKAGPKVRKERIDLDNVSALEPVVEQTPPITVNHPSMVIIDGHHRQAAAARRGVPLRAVLVAMTDAEVFEAAVKANVTHGLALTLAERKSNAERMVKDWPEWSDRRIAEACGLSHPAVAGLRPTGKAIQLDTRKREGTDGKSRPANPAVQRADVDAAIKADPTASAREVARRTGASPTTVSNRKAHLASVPEVRTDSPPTIGELIVMAPVVWKDEKSCQRTNATREFARFMDHFTTWNRTQFWEHVAAQAPECPAELREAAADVARSMAGAWTRLANDLSKHDLSEAK